MLAKRFDSPKDKIKLFDIPTDSDGGLSKSDAETKFGKQCAELSELQELLYAAGTHALLVVLQGRDTAGKDGAVRCVAGALNPSGTRVTSFKVPTPDERAHDFLWRIHQQTPKLGEVVFFNRSHYEDVLVVRVHELAPKKIWKARYEQINAFETLLADSNVLVVKFCLHLSKDEQEKRLLEREEDPTKAWKLNPGDWAERKLWDDYTDAYEDAIAKCASKSAPWYVVPADKKYFRNVAMAEALIETLKPHKSEWQAALAKLGATQKAALAKMRQ
jgi:PPK2 family polyphosphate:nucleotide phosphotransferase